MAGTRLAVQVVRTWERLVHRSAELSRHVDATPEGPVVRYDYSHRLPPYTVRPPWRSAFANAAVALGFMQATQAMPGRRDELMRVALAYLKPATTILAWTDESGDLWFTEYIGPGLPNQRIGVMNGHFFVIDAMHEWRRRTSGMTSIRLTGRSALASLHFLTAYTVGVPPSRTTSTLFCGPGVYPSARTGAGDRVLTYAPRVCGR